MVFVLHKMLVVALGVAAARVIRDDALLASGVAVGNEPLSTCACQTLEDVDADGIPDCAESEGCDFFGLPLYEWGARVGVKDIFVEVDYMDCKDPGVQPREEALKMVTEAFAAASGRGVKVAIHFDVGSLYESGEFDLGGGNSVPCHTAIGMPALTDPNPHEVDLGKKMNLFAIKHEHFSHKRASDPGLAREAIFRWVLFANSISEDGSPVASGGSRIGGTTAYVTLGGWDLNARDAESKALLVNMQAATLMHEIGHTFGLRHGGGDNTDNKPNYMSIMNYLYQHNGLPPVVDGTYAGDRYYLEAGWKNPECRSLHLGDGLDSWEGRLRAIASGPFTTDFAIDYSAGTMPDIDEAGVDETEIGWDLDCDGELSTSAKCPRSTCHECNDDILSRWDRSHPDQTDACSGKNPKRAVLGDFDDWRSLQLVHASFLSSLDTAPRLLGEYAKAFRQWAAGAEIVL